MLYRVSIHALLAECDKKPTVLKIFFRKFQSTHSLRSATSSPLSGGAPKAFQSTHSLRSATRRIGKSNVLLAVSIHALLAECDLRHRPAPGPSPGFNPRTPCGVRLWYRLPGCGRFWFQSTHSLRSATFSIGLKSSAHTVSIHALLAECDYQIKVFPHPFESFNPRTPCGVRLFSVHVQRQLPRFQSTHSLRSATPKNSPRAKLFQVSIHALLAECDVLPVVDQRRIKGFNPRTPCGVRPCKS